MIVKRKIKNVQVVGNQTREKKTLVTFSLMENTTIRVMKTSRRSIRVQSLQVAITFMSFLLKKKMNVLRGCFFFSSNSITQLNITSMKQRDARRRKSMFVFFSSFPIESINKFEENNL